MEKPSTFSFICAQIKKGENLYSVSFHQMTENLTVWVIICLPLFFRLHQDKTHHILLLCLFHWCKRMIDHMVRFFLSGSSFCYMIFLFNREHVELAILTRITIQRFNWNWHPVAVIVKIKGKTFLKNCVLPSTYNPLEVETVSGYFPLACGWGIVWIFSRSCMDMFRSSFYSARFQFCISPFSWLNKDELVRIFRWLMFIQARIWRCGVYMIVNVVFRLRHWLHKMQLILIVVIAVVQLHFDNICYSLMRIFSL